MTPDERTELFSLRGVVAKCREDMDSHLGRAADHVDERIATLETKLDRLQKALDKLFAQQGNPSGKP